MIPFLVFVIIIGFPLMLAVRLAYLYRLYGKDLPKRPRRRGLAGFDDAGDTSATSEPLAPGEGPAHHSTHHHGHDTGSHSHDAGGGHHAGGFDAGGGGFDGGGGHGGH